MRAQMNQIQSVEVWFFFRRGGWGPVCAPQTPADLLTERRRLSKPSSSHFLWGWQRTNPHKTIMVLIQHQHTEGKLKSFQRPKLSHIILAAFTCTFMIQFYVFLCSIKPKVFFCFMIILWKAIGVKIFKQYTWDLNFNTHSLTVLIHQLTQRLVKMRLYLYMCIRLFTQQP